MAPTASTAASVAGGTRTQRGPLSQRIAALQLGSVEADALVSHLVDEALRLWGGQRYVLWTYEPALGRLFARPRHRDPRAIAVTDAEAGRLLTDVAMWPPPLSQVQWRLVEASFGVAADDGCQPLVSVPLCADDEPVGLLIVDGLAADSAAAARDLTAPFAAQAAAALVNHRALADGRRHEAQLEALYRTAGELSSQLKLQQVLDAIIERARSLAAAPIGYIMLIDLSLNEIYMRATAGVTHAGFGRIRLSIGAGLGGMAAAEGRPFYTSDYLNDRHFDHRGPVDDEVRAEGIKSILGVPMRTRGEFVGVLYVADREVRVFSSGEVDVLVSLAQHAALAIENAQLYERATSALQEVSRTNEVVRAQNERLRRVDDAQRQLSDIVLAGTGLDAISDLISELVGAPVVVLDERHQPLASAGEPSDPFGTKLVEAGLMTAMRRAPGVARVLEAVSGSTPMLLEPGGDRTRSRLVVPVVAGAEVLATVWAECDAPVIEDIPPVVEQAARVVALELLKERSVAEVERRQRRELLDELLSERPSPENVVARRAAEVGLDLRRPHALAVASTQPREARPGQGAVDERRDELVAALRQQPWCAFVAEYAGHVVALVTPGTDEPHAALAPAIAELHHGDRWVRAMISPPCLAPRDYRKHFESARRALELLAGRMHQPVADLEDMRVLTLLFGQGGEEELDDFVNGRLGPVLADSRHARLELVPTLEAYLASGASPARTASALHVHVNTVYYRLGRLRELLGDDFSEAPRALDLQVACLALRLLCEEPPKQGPEVRRAAP